MSSQSSADGWKGWIAPMTTIDDLPTTKGSSMKTVTVTHTHTACGHPGNNVVADILDGDFHGGPGGEQGVQWCRGCGAYRRVFDPFGEYRLGEWRTPDGN